MNWVKSFRFRWLNIHPSNRAIPIVTEEGAKYWIEVNESQPTAIIVSHNGKVCGLVRMIWYEDRLELWDLFIWEKHRGHGLGTALLQWIIMYARQENEPKIWAIVSPEPGLDFERVMAWYLRQGFHQVSCNSRAIVYDLNRSTEGFV